VDFHHQVIAHAGRTIKRGCPKSHISDLKYGKKAGVLVAFRGRSASLLKHVPRALRGLAWLTIPAGVSQHTCFLPLFY